MKLEKSISGERLVLRSYRKADLEFLTDMWFDEENGKYLSDPTENYVDAVYRKALDELEESASGYYLVAELVGSGECIGSAMIFPAEQDEYEIAYCVHKNKWRQGFGEEIVSLLLAQLKERGAKKVTAEVAEDNLPSTRLLQKLGFAPERKSGFSKYNMDVRYRSVLYAKALEE